MSLMPSFPIITWVPIILFYALMDLFKKRFGVSRDSLQLMVLTLVWAGIILVPVEKITLNFLVFPLLISGFFASNLIKEIVNGKTTDKLATAISGLSFLMLLLVYRFM